MRQLRILLVTLRHAIRRAVVALCCKRTPTLNVKTQEEIVKKIKYLKEDLFGDKRQFLMEYLDFEHAQPWLKPEVTKDQWLTPKPLERDSVLAEMLSYMGFAWNKANNCRGLSAMRSMEH